MPAREFTVHLGLTLLLGCVWTAHAGTLYAVGPWQVGAPSDLYSLDPETGAATLIGSTGVERLGGLAYANESLYAYNTVNLYRLDPETGTATLVGPLGSSHPEGGLSFDPVSGKLYGVKSVANDELVVIDTESGASTRVGFMGPNARDTGGLAFDADGLLYGVAYRGVDPDQLIRIDPQSAVVTVIGEVGTPPTDPSVGGLEFDPDSGVLYFVNAGDLYTLDTADGSASLVGPTGVSNLGGLAVISGGPGCNPCDTNCDGSVNGQDIVGFVNALHGDPEPCSPCNSDVNGDGSINGQDIVGFVDCLNGP